MKITDICESTTAGSIAPVSAPMNGRARKRSPVGNGVYGKGPAGSLLTGKETSKKFANSKGVNESATEYKGEEFIVLYINGVGTFKYKSQFEADEALDIAQKADPNAYLKFEREIRGGVGGNERLGKVGESQMPREVLKSIEKLAGMTDAELADHLKDKSDDELRRMAWRHGYGYMSPRYVDRVKKGKEINEAELQEDDIIIVPGQGHKRGGFISRADDRRDHEVEMARGDLYQAHKNSSKIHKLIKHVSEDEGLEGWVQAKITKAADYLNSVRQYLESKKLQEMTGGVIADSAYDQTPPHRVPRYTTPTKGK